MKKRIMSLIMLCVFIMMAGCAGSREEPPVQTEGMAEYRLNNGSEAPYDGGVLVRLSRMWVFDEASRQMVPLCTRAECDHEYDIDTLATNDCPAVYLGYRASSFAVYGGKIWYVHLNDGNSVWEFWTADLNGENHTKMFEVSESEAVPNAPSLFYQDYYYTMRMEFFPDEVTGETDLGYRIVAISLLDGTEEEITGEMEMEQGPRFVGVHEDQVYYIASQIDGEDFTRNLYRVSRSTGKTETIASCERSAADMNETWLVYGTAEEGGKICLIDLDTGEESVIYEGEHVANIVSIELSENKVLVPVWNDEMKGYSCFIYDIERKDYKETPCYERIGIPWTNLGGVWFTTIPKDASQIDPNGDNDSWIDCFYIEEEDFLAGKELIQVK